MASIDDLIKELQLDNLEMEEGVPLSKAESPTRDHLAMGSSSLTDEMNRFSTADNVSALHDGGASSLSAHMNPSVAMAGENECLMVGTPSGHSQSDDSEKSNSTVQAADHPSSAAPRLEQTEDPIEEERRLPTDEEEKPHAAEKPDENEKPRIEEKMEGRIKMKEDRKEETSKKAPEPAPAGSGEKQFHSFDMEEDVSCAKTNDPDIKPLTPHALANATPAKGSGSGSVRGSASGSPSYSGAGSPLQRLRSGGKIDSSSPLFQRFTVPFPTNPSTANRGRNMSHVVAALGGAGEGEEASPKIPRFGYTGQKNRGKSRDNRESNAPALFRCTNCCFLTTVSGEDLPAVNFSDLLEVSDTSRFLNRLGENDKIPLKGDVMRRKGAFYAYLQGSVGNGARDAHGDPKEKGGCPFIKCLKCQCIVVRLKGAEWRDNKGTLNLYLTLRNYYPDWSHLAAAAPVMIDSENMAHSEDSEKSLSAEYDSRQETSPSERVLKENPRATAYCCQCSWVTVFGEKEKITTVLLDAAKYRQEESITSHPFATRAPLADSECRRLPLWTCIGHPNSDDAC